MSKPPPEHFDLSLTREVYTADCLLCGWHTELKQNPRFSNEWWWHSLRVHAWHFCPPRKQTEPSSR